MGDFYKAAAAPRWAVRRAFEETMAYDPSWAGVLEHVMDRPTNYPAVIALARYIAKHEEPPKDPLQEALSALVVIGSYRQISINEQAELLRAELAQRGIKIERMDQ